jgi:DnaK suppressor protein
MKTIAKKTVKKAAPKAKAVAVAKVAVKVVAKKSVKPVKAVAKTPVKAVKKPLAKPAAKTIAKPAPKAVAKKAVKAVAKPAVKAKAVKATVEPAKKIAKPIKAVKPTKTEKPAKAVKIAKAEPKPTKAESKLKQPMVIASKTVPTESKLATKPAAIETTPAAPVLSKARTSRLASLTVPSMAQAIASTAAKSSYGPAVHAQTFIIPPQSAPKQNPKLANNWKTKTAEEMSDEELLAMPESEYMNIKQMMYFRLKLIELKKGILESAGATTEHLRDDSAVVPDPTDRATIEEEHALELRTRDRERKLLKKIEQSIGRIDAGDYGYCDETGEAIGVGRLLARPTATLSLEAQQRRELKQKMFGD